MTLIELPHPSNRAELWRARTLSVECDGKALLAEFLLVEPLGEHRWEYIGLVAGAHVTMRMDMQDGSYYLMWSDDAAQGV